MLDGSEWERLPLSRGSMNQKLVSDFHVVNGIPIHTWTILKPFPQRLIHLQPDLLQIIQSAIEHS